MNQQARSNIALIRRSADPSVPAADRAAASYEFMVRRYGAGLYGSLSASCYFDAVRRARKIRRLRGEDASDESVRSLLREVAAEWAARNAE